jgi:hypothetical protein
MLREQKTLTLQRFLFFSFQFTRSLSKPLGLIIHAKFFLQNRGVKSAGVGFEPPPQEMSPANPLFSFILRIGEVCQLLFHSQAWRAT